MSLVQPPSCPSLSQWDLTVRLVFPFISYEGHFDFLMMSLTLKPRPHSDLNRLISQPPAIKNTGQQQALAWSWSGFLEIPTTSTLAFGTFPPVLASLFENLGSAWSFQARSNSLLPLCTPLLSAPTHLQPGPARPQWPKLHIRGPGWVHSCPCCLSPEEAGGCCWLESPFPPRSNWHPRNGSLEG
jgi:hypothetical protein